MWIFFVTASTAAHVFFTQLVVNFAKTRVRRLPTHARWKAIFDWQYLVRSMRPKQANFVNTVLGSGVILVNFSLALHLVANHSSEPNYIMAIFIYPVFYFGAKMISNLVNWLVIRRHQNELLRSIRRVQIL